MNMSSEDFNYPTPNEQGVYDRCEGERITLEYGNDYAHIDIVQISESEWVSSLTLGINGGEFSYSPQAKHGFFQSRAEALEIRLRELAGTARHQLNYESMSDSKKARWLKMLDLAEADQHKQITLFE